MFQTVTFGAQPFHPSKALKNDFGKQTFAGDFIYATRRWCSLRATPSITGALFVRHSLLRGQVARFSPNGFTVESSPSLPWGRQQRQLTDFSTSPGGAHCHAACKLAGKILYVLAWSQPEKLRWFRCSSELSVPWPPRRRNMSLACGLKWSRCKY